MRGKRVYYIRRVLAQNSSAMWRRFVTYSLGGYRVRPPPQSNYGSVKEPNKLHIYETERITRKASDAAENIELFGSFTRDRHARRI